MCGGSFFTQDFWALLGVVSKLGTGDAFKSTFSAVPIIITC